MKAIRVHQFGGPEVLRLDEVPVPKPAAGQVLVKLHAVGVNPVETYFRSGANPNLMLPWTPGMDGAGIIESIGEGVAGVKSGDRVYTSDTLTGSYAQFTLCEPRGVHPLPEKISFAQGAALGIPYATAHRALFHRARALAGEIVFIHGASGGVGLAATQIARAAGLTVIGSAGVALNNVIARTSASRLIRSRGVISTVPRLPMTMTRPCLASRGRSLPRFTFASISRIMSTPRPPVRPMTMSR